MYEHLRGMTEAALKENLKNPMWRIRNLYYILDKDKQTVLFVPNEAQEKFLEDLWYRNIIPKARQRGFSTVAQLVILDACLFVVNTIGAVIAQDQTIAAKIMRQKIKFAYFKLPAFIRKAVPYVINNVHEMTFGNGSSITVSTSARGDTLSWLHVSEFGAICANSPDKAEEIITGALPAAENGITIIESTAKGRDGAYYDMVQIAKKRQDSGKQLSKQDYRLHFASWWDADEYEVDPAYVVMSKKDHDYFDRMETIIKTEISLPKRAWYVATRENTFSGAEEKMWTEYPTHLDEAFQISTEGTYLRDQLVLARKQNRITLVPHRTDLPVNTFWDLGISDDIAIWFHQQVGQANCFINFIEGSGEAYSYFVKQMEAMGYIWGRHFLPHDGNQRRPDAKQLKTPADMLEELKLRNIVIVPRTPDLNGVGIPALREQFSTYYFDAVNCDAGLKHLEGYRKQWNVRNQNWSEEPQKNGHQHAADALRQHAQMADEVRNGGTPTTPKRKSRSGLAA